MGNISAFEMSATSSLAKFVRLTHDHGGNIEPVLGAGNLASGTTQLGIDLHGNIGAVLRLSLDDMGNVDT
jgi:hypothetical protein